MATAVVGAVVAGDCVPPAGVLAGAVVVGFGRVPRTPAGDGAAGAAVVAGAEELVAGPDPDPEGPLGAPEAPAGDAPVAAGCPADTVDPVVPAMMAIDVPGAVDAAPLAGSLSKGLLPAAPPPRMSNQAPPRLRGAGLSAVGAATSAIGWSALANDGLASGAAGAVPRSTAPISSTPISAASAHSMTTNAPNGIPSSAAQRRQRLRGALDGPEAAAAAGPSALPAPAASAIAVDDGVGCAPVVRFALVVRLRLVIREDLDSSTPVLRCGRREPFMPYTRSSRPGDDAAEEDFFAPRCCAGGAPGADTAAHHRPGGVSEGT